MVTALGVNTWQGVTYLDRDRLERILRLLVGVETIAGGARAGSTARTIADRLSTTAESAGYRVDAIRGTLRPPPTRDRASRKA
jgi:hypothetical protein